MKVDVLKENLERGLSVIERVTGKNISLPILDNVLVSAEQNFLNLVATDLESAVKLWMLAKIIEQGKVCVSAKVFMNLVTLLPNEKITLTEDKSTLHIESKASKNKLQGLNAEEFPLIPEFKNVKEFKVNSSLLSQAVSQVIDILQPSQSKPEISGVYFSFSKNLIKVVATDTFRLAEKKIFLDNNLQEEILFILPQKPAKELVNIFSNADKDLHILFSQNQIMFETLMKEFNNPEVQLVSRLIDGEYPNYEEIIPKEFKTTAVLKRDEFLNKAKAAAIFTGRISEIKITTDVKKGTVSLFSSDASIGENYSEIQASKIEGEDMSISFNHKFLTDGLSKIKSSEFIFQMSKEDGPCIIRPVGDDSYIYVVMPIKA